MSTFGCLLVSCSQGTFLKFAVPITEPEQPYFVHAGLHGLLATLPLDTCIQIWPDIPSLLWSTLCHHYSLGAYAWASLNLLVTSIAAPAARNTCEDAAIRISGLQFGKQHACCRAFPPP